MADSHGHRQLTRRDIAAGTPGEPGPGVPVRLYEPGRTEPTGALVWIHGGGWVSGSIEQDDPLCAALATRGGVPVLSVDYHLAPEHPFPRPLEDCAGAASWLRANAAQLGIDRESIGIGGESAGGNLAAGTALLLRDRQSWTLALQLLVCPALAGTRTAEFASGRTYADGFGNDTADRDRFWNAYIRSDADGRSPYAAPLLAGDLRGLPPAWIITAEQDPIRDEAEEYGRRLAAAGTPASWHRVPGARHGITDDDLANVHKLDNPVALACQAIGTYLRGSRPPAATTRQD